MISSVMKKLLAAISAIAYLFFPALAYAQIDVGVSAPSAGVNPNLTVGTFLSNILTIIFVVAALAVLFMLVWGAFSWITSGGDKDAVGGARKRIINALIGLAVLALAFFITRVVGQLVNIDILSLTNLPTLNTPRTDAERAAVEAACIKRRDVDKELVKWCGAPSYTCIKNTEICPTAPATTTTR